MIVVCKKCYTPYLVQDDLITENGKKVRCSKCKHMWVEIPIHIEEYKFEATTELATKKTTIIIDKLKRIYKKLSPKALLKSKRFFRQAKVVYWKIRRVTKTVLKPANIKKALKIITSITATLIIITVFALFAGHHYIVAQWPILQKAYVAIGWVDEKQEQLILHDVASERSYKDGAMHLIVKGTIHSIAKKTQVIPTIRANAIGADGSIIESWLIQAPKATIKSKGNLNFRSMILAPEGTVTEINLSFLDNPHEADD